MYWQSPNGQSVITWLFVSARALQLQPRVWGNIVRPLRHDTPIENPPIVICLKSVFTFIACFKPASDWPVLKVGLSKFFFRVSVALFDLDERRQRAREQVRAQAGRRARDQLLGWARASISVGGGRDQSITRGANHYFGDQQHRLNPMQVNKKYFNKLKKKHNDVHLHCFRGFWYWPPLKLQRAQPKVYHLLISHVVLNLFFPWNTKWFSAFWVTLKKSNTRIFFLPVNIKVHLKWFTLRKHLFF